MIVLAHNNQEVTAVFFKDTGLAITFNTNKNLSRILFDIAKSYPKELIIWVHQEYKEAINFEEIKTLFHHKLIMASYSVSGQYAIPSQIGYVEHKPFVNVPRKVRFATWLMSSDIGGIYSETLNKIKSSIKNEVDLDYSLCALAKQAMPKGLFCYSDPRLLKKGSVLTPIYKKQSIYQLFKFVKQQYKLVWSFNLLLCLAVFEKKYAVLSFFSVLFKKQIRNKIDFSTININSSLKIIENEDIDVIIPTIGRKPFLLDVLNDLAQQTLLPKRVIIIEQNPVLNAVSELDYLTEKDWPFQIKHQFIHQTGVCNARNLALSLVESEWVLLGDDDNRFDVDLIEKLFIGINRLGCTVATTMYIQPDETANYFHLNQTDIFGSGNSMFKSNLISQVKFDPAFEFGFGEDSDFGMQLRKKGHDVIFFPDIKITHLKAPIGGFRTKVKQLWDNDKIQPKPSPTIMLYAKKHYNRFQMDGYKYVLFLKFYKKQEIRNPFGYIRKMNLMWQQSVYWSSILMQRKDA